MENQIFNDEEIKKFVEYFSAEEFNQFAYIIIDKAFDLHPEKERIYFREKCLTSIEGAAYKFKLPKDATDFQKSNTAATVASKLLVVINKKIEDGEFVMPQKED